MPDLKISQLTSLAGGSLASNDVVAVVDTSASETKKITSQELVQYGYGLITAGTLDGDIIESGTTLARGTVQLEDSTSSTSTTTAATPNAVKTAYDLAGGALPLAGGTMTGAILADDSTSPSTPGYAFKDDTNTGLLRTGVDELALVTGGTSRLTIDSAGAVVIPGDLTIQGTTTTIDTTNLEIEDKNIEIGKVDTPTDVTADGGGITLKGSTDKTINWIDATDAWTFSEHVDIADAKEYRINNVKVLDATSLGSAVVSSSLTSVGTIGTGAWQGTAVGTAYGGTGQTTYANGQLLIGKTDGTLAKATLTQGTNVTITNGDGAITIAASLPAGTLTTSDIGVSVQGYDADTAKLDVVQTFTAVQTLTDPAIIGTIKEDIYTITDGAAFEIDPSEGSVQVITLGDSRTPKATNFADGESVTLMVDDGTAYTLTWTDATFGGSGVVWKTDAGSAPTLNTTGYTVIVLWKVSSQVYGARVGNA